MTRRYRRLVDLALGGRHRIDDEMDQEIDAHVEMRIADLVRGGMSPDEARAEARRRFGDFDAARRRLHAAARQRDASVRNRDVLGSVVADLRTATRQAKRAPGFTAIAIGALALGLGATTAIFTLVERIVLRPLPFPHAEQLLAVSGLDSASREAFTVSSADWLDWRSSTALQSSAIYSFPYRQGIVAGDSAMRLTAVTATGGMFRVLGSHFVVGRPFTESDASDGTPTVVISERVWRQMFGADPQLSMPLRTATRAYRILGVVASDQGFPEGVDVWFPVDVTVQADPVRVNINWLMIARRRGDVSTDQAWAALTGVARGIRERDPTAIYDYGVATKSLTNSVIGDVSSYFRMLIATVGVVLLIVCANIAASSMARAQARAREMAVRSSLGAARVRLVQQMLLEHVWLGLVGGCLGLGLAWASIRGVLAVWGDRIPRANEVTMDGRVFAFALALSIVAGALSGIIPAMRVTRVSLSGLLQSGGRGSAAGGRNLAGASLVSLEIALALLLLTGAGLLLRSFRSVLSRDIGFDTDVATAEAALSGPLYATDTLRRYAYWDQLLAELRAIPGVQGAAVSQWIPLGLTGQGFVDVEGRDATGMGAVYRTVSEDFFRTLRIPLVVGRTFGAEDGSTTPRVAVINRVMAQRFFPGENPIGRRIRARSQEPGLHGQPAPWLTIVGVVGDIRTYGLESDARAEMYVDFRQTPRRTTSMTALVRGSTSAANLLGEIRQRARRVDPNIAVDVGTLEDRLHATLATRSLAMSLLSAFAAVAALLAALGIYGVLSFAVAQRTRELAVRSALGARRGQLLSLVLSAGLKVALIGLAFGIVGALGLSRTMKALLVGVTPFDPLTYTGAAVMLGIVVLAAILVPAVRATRMDPVIALQAE
jgi:predicted permease